MQILKGKQYFNVRSFENLREMLDQSERLYRDKVAFCFRDNPEQTPQTRTFGAFRGEVDELGTALCALGLQGSHIAIVGENSYAWCLSFASAVCGAGVAVPLDRLLPPEEIIGLMQRGSVQVVFYDPSFQQMLQENSNQLPGVKLLVRLRDTQSKKIPDLPWDKPDAGLADEKPVWMRMEDLLQFGKKRLQEGSVHFREIAIDSKAMMSLLFTSGTTQASKAVMLSHANVSADIRGIAGVINLKPGTRMLSVLPLHHTFENTCGFFMALYIGAEIYVSDGLRYIQKNMKEYGIDMIVGVPLLFANFYTKIQTTLAKTGKDKLVRKLIKITRALRHVGIDLRRIVFRQLLDAFGGRLKIGICGAAPIDPEIITFFDDIGFRILQGYGLTETAPVVCGCHSRLFVPGTVGQPVSGVEVAIDTDRPGEDGEILVRGPIVMMGYYQDPEETARVIDQDGWFHTGDLGRIDPSDQCIRITGRVKSMIVLKNGKKVFPEEIEQLIGHYEWVKESIVWGVDGPDGEVVVSAKLVIDTDLFSQQTGSDADESGIRAAIEKIFQDINSSLPSFKKVRHFVFSFKELVKTTTMKVRRPIEIDRIRQMMEKHKYRWQDVTGRNIDTYDQSDNSSDQK